MPTAVESLESSQFAPAVIAWARTNAGLDVDETVEKFGTSSRHIEKSLLLAWESGAVSPSFSDVKRLSEIFKTPLAVFFLSEPPSTDQKPQDYRTLGSKDHKGLSFKTNLMLRKARLAQDHALALAQSMDVDIKFKLRRYALSDNPTALAGQIRQKLNFAIAEQLKAKKPTNVFDSLRAKIESTGVLVQKSAQSNNFPLEDARAISLVDREPYLIIINNADRDHAQIFSLMHEFSHVLLREAGICNDFEDYVRNRANEIRRIETFCNEFAASFLLPEDDFRSHASTFGNLNGENLGDALDVLSSDFKVSKSAVLRRLLTFRLIAKSQYDEQMAEWESGNKKNLKKKGGRNNPAKTAVAANGPTFTGLTVRAYQQQKISFASVSDYLGIKTKYINALENLLRRT